MPAAPAQKAARTAFVGELCFDRLTNDPEELLRFMNAVGYDPSGLRAAVGSESLNRAMIEYVAANEPLMLTVCTGAAIRPEEFMRAYYALNPAG